MRQHEVVDRPGFRGRQAERLARLLLPVQLHHARQAVDHHIEEAAHTETEQGSTQNKGQHMAGQ
ncbi:hypothetical protein D3C76_1342580 [compost metagenome]